MSNKENLEGIVAKLKEQGINAGEAEKQRIIEAAKKEADALIAEAESIKKNIIEEATTKAEQAHKNAQIAIAQASRDMVEATKVSVLKHMESVFGSLCEGLFTQEEYMKELTKAVVDSISGNKKVMLAPEMSQKVEAFLLENALKDQIELQPLAKSEAKIVVKSTDKKGVEFVLSSQDVKQGLFSLLNKDLVERITKNTEE